MFGLYVRLEIHLRNECLPALVTHRKHGVVYACTVLKIRGKGKWVINVEAARLLTTVRIASEAYLSLQPATGHLYDGVGTKEVMSC